MALGKAPVFRKMIVVWYDSEKACIFILCCALLLITFGISGISVAANNPQYACSAWVPVTLTVFAVILAIYAILRLLRLYSEG